MTKPKALEIADGLDAHPLRTITSQEAAKELRRLHELNQELREALHAFLRAPHAGSGGMGAINITVQEFNLRAAKAAIAKADGEQA